MRVPCQTPFWLALLIASPLAFAKEQSQPVKPADKNWQVYSDLSLFAFSEAVSIKEFVNDFNDGFQRGKTAFTQDKFELGVRWHAFRFAYVDRYDYITEFSKDTAFVYHADKNNIDIPADQEFDLFLSIERIRARGLKAGYSWDFNDNLSFDVAATYYFDMSQLQSGKVKGFGTLDPLNDDVLSEARDIFDDLDASNRDLDPLRDLAKDINASLLINYAYDEPKFGEKDYQKPVFVGPDNPPVTGVDFSEPDGWGYAFDFALDWQVNEQLNLNLQLLDVGNKFKWNSAPRTFAKIDVNPALQDFIDVAQEFVNGEIVKPNEIVDRQLTVDIFNADYDQTLPWRADLTARYSFVEPVSLLGWKPRMSLVTEYYYTDMLDFPRIGVGFNDSLDVLYDFNGDAFIVEYNGTYGFVKLIADRLDPAQAHTMGISMGINYRF